MVEQILMAWLGLGLTGLIVGAAGVRLTALKMKRSSSKPAPSDKVLDAA